MLDTEDISRLLARLDALQREIETVRAAPLPVEERIRLIEADVDAHAERFRRMPWSAQAGQKAMACALWPKDVVRFETERLRREAAADPRQVISRAERTARLASAQRTLDGALAQLSHSALHELEEARNAAHAPLRGIEDQRDAVRSRRDRRAAAIEQLNRERERGGRSAPMPADPWPGYFPGGEQPLEPQPEPRRLSRAEREALVDGYEKQIEAERAALARDERDLAAADAEYERLARAWDAIARLTDRYDRWLKRKPAAIVEQGVYENA